MDAVGDARGRVVRGTGSAGSWAEPGSGAPASDYEYGVFLADGSVVGGCGLHRRIGPSALEIGYWVHVAHTRRGIATAAAGALTAVGFGMARHRAHGDPL